MNWLCISVHATFFKISNIEFVFRLFFDGLTVFTECVSQALDKNSKWQTVTLEISKVFDILAFFTSSKDMIFLVGYLFKSNRFNKSGNKGRVERPRF